MRKITLAASGLVAVMALCIFMAPAHQASAIESSGIGALPANPRPDNPRTKSIFIYDLASSVAVSDGIKIVNNTDSPKTLAVYPVDSQASSDGAFACAQMVEPKKEVGSWIKLDQEQVTLPANSNQIIPFTLSAPAGAAPGEHNGCIVVQNVAPEAAKKTENGIVLSFRSALRVAVTVPGALQANLKFVDVQSHDINRTTLGISPILQNTGNVSADATIDVKLTGIFGLHYPFASIDERFPVFPGPQNRFNFELKKPAWGGWYSRDVQAHYRKPLASGELGNTVTYIEAASAIIFIAPQPLELAIETLIALLIIALTWYTIRSIRRRDLRLLPTESYIVQEGETIDAIAHRHNTKWRQLAKLNNIKSPYNVHAGQIIEVPSLPIAAGTKDDKSHAHKPKKAKPTNHKS